MEPSSNKIGKKIKRYRLLNDIRQEDMAEQMGVSRATLINYEKGYTTINLDEVRHLTSKERAMIQTFPKDFIFDGSKVDIEQFIGNAVPPNLAEFVGNSIVKYMCKDFREQHSLF